MTTYHLELTLDDVIEVLVALAGRQVELRGLDPEFTGTLSKVRAQLVAQRADGELITNIMQTELPDVFP